MPLFHSSALQQAVDDIERHMHTACDCIAAAANGADGDSGGPINLLTFIQQAALAVSFKVSFGVELLSSGSGDGAVCFPTLTHPG